MNRARLRVVPAPANRDADRRAVEANRREFLAAMERAPGYARREYHWRWILLVASVVGLVMLFTGGGR